jgi:putative ABC transport system permease protein
MFFPADKSDVNYIALKVQEGKSDAVNERLSNLWHRVAPNDPYEGFGQQKVMDVFFRENQANITLLSSISGMALFLACIGLYGLVSFQVRRKMKEISVRRVLGAGMGHLSYIINRDYYLMLGIAMMLGLPLGYLMINQLIQAIYPEPEPTTIWPFVISVAILGIAIMITLGSQLLRVNKENPVNILRSE